MGIFRSQPVMNFIGWRIFFEPYSFDSESDLLPVANDNEPKKPDPEQPAEPEPVSDYKSSISSLISAYSLNPTLLTPAERTLRIRAAHSRELMQKKHARQHTIVTLAPIDIVSLKIP